MLLIPNALFTEYVAHLNRMKIPEVRFTEYKKWLRYYLDFCDKYPVPDAKSGRVRLFCEKLKEKKQTVAQRERAAHAVSLYFEMMNHRGPSSLEGDSGPGKGATSLAERVQSENDLLPKSGKKANNQNAIESVGKPPQERRLVVWPDYPAKRFQLLVCFIFSQNASVMTAYMAGNFGGEADKPLMVGVRHYRL